MKRPHRPGGALSTPLAVVLATAVHVLTVTVAAFGVVLLWSGTSVIVKILGVVCLLLAYTLRPTLGGAKSEGRPLDLERCPQTTAIIEEVASVIGSAVPTRVEITTTATADLRLTGLRGRVVSVGVSLWLALSGPERLALISHELGHLARGDLLMRRYVDGAEQTLRRWENFLSPYRPGFAIDPQDQILVASSGSDVVAQNAMVGIFGGIVSVLLWPFRVFVTGYRRLIQILAAPSRDGHALHADAAAVKVAGTEATIAMLEVLLALPSVETAANRAAATRQDIRASIASRMAAFDAGQRQSLRNGDGTVAIPGHRPTLERLRLVESGERAEPTVVVGREQWAAVDQEISRAVADQLRRLADNYLYSH
jgi:Zn-dependent protease with chaperone function